MKGKKADWMMDNWAEFFAFVVLILGFLFAISAGSAVILYIIALLFGSAFGRWWFRFKTNLKVPAAIISLGALIGITLGSFYGRRDVVVILFVLGYVGSYYLHDRKILHSAEY